MESVTSGEVGGEYEHWPDDATQLSDSSIAATGYDSHNGLREFQYHPADEVKAPAVEPPKAQPIPYAYQPPVNAPPPAQCASYYPPMQYAYPPQMACPAPAYYGYPGAHQVTGYPYYPPGYTPIFASAPAPVVEEKKSRKRSPRKWQGRSKAEVEDDNMKIAQREGAYAARKVESVGLQEDQMVWVVETDGSHTLR